MAQIHPAIAAQKVAVVTGAASGIGRATAVRLAELGMRVGLVDSEAPALAEALAALPGGGHASFAVDVSDRAAVEALAAQVARELGPVSLLMNNAGVGGGGDALSNPDGWARVMGVNLFGVLHGVQAFVPAMAASGAPGLVINTGSKQGITQPPGDTAYNASKSAVKALTEGLAHTLRNLPDCRVSAHLLLPGFTYTGMVARRVPQRPPSAWTPDQLVERLLQGLAAGEFYILCEDNETSRAQDEKRILWSAQDLIANRPALSRWHPDWQDAFTRFMADDA
ncbi:SDR family NAD(P)-dependent oxidoreductase [Phenylobacterium sp. LjRoot219]|uniref:SDR family NAD(P)-dependent oxidoreductase n=1 Tax=Phenylobacterium sp. LjRoot219 TaxID=3342283 RepID=UPI003ECF7164